MKVEQAGVKKREGLHYEADFELYYHPVLDSGLLAAYLLPEQHEGSRACGHDLVQCLSSVERGILISYINIIYN